MCSVISFDFTPLRSGQALTLSLSLAVIPGPDLGSRVVAFAHVPEENDAGFPLTTCRNPSCRLAACTPRDENGTRGHPELVLSGAKDLAKDLVVEVLGY